MRKVMTVLVAGALAATLSAPAFAEDRGPSDQKRFSAQRDDDGPRDYRYRHNRGRGDRGGYGHHDGYRHRHGYHRGHHGYYGHRHHRDRYYYDRYYYGGYRGGYYGYRGGYYDSRARE